MFIEEEEDGRVFEADLLRGRVVVEVVFIPRPLVVPEVALPSTDMSESLLARPLCRPATMVQSKHRQLGSTDKTVTRHNCWFSDKGFPSTHTVVMAGHNDNRRKLITLHS